MKLKIILSLAFYIGINTMNAQEGNVGVGITDPGTRLDVNGAITHRESLINITSNTAAIPTNISQIQLTGAATGNIFVLAPAAPNSGQRLVIYNNSTGNFDAVLNSTVIQNGKTIEFIYSNSNWQPIDGGRFETAQNAFNRKYYDWLKPGGQILTDSGDNSVDIYHTGRVGIGVSNPQAFLDITGIASGADAATTVRARSMPFTDNTTLINKQTLVPLYISGDGYIVKGISPAVFPNSYSFNGSIGVNSGTTSGAIFSGITSSTIVTFKFISNFSFGNSNTAILYGNISYSNKRGFQIDSDWSYSGNTSTSNVNITGVGTNSLVFDFVSGPDLTFSYSGGIIRATKAAGGTNTNLFIYEGTKIR